MRLPLLAGLLALLLNSQPAQAATHSVAKPATESSQNFHIIPLPKALKPLGGAPFRLTARTPLVADGDSAHIVSRFFADKLRQATGYALPLSTGSRAVSRGIFARIDPKLPLGEEGYRLTATARGVELVGRTARGLFYAYQSLLQLLPAEVESPRPVAGITWQLPAVEILDEPAFAYRGLMLDACRHFLSVEEMKKHIDLISLFKINRLHWHLTEDQGWRIEIKRYPRLTDIASKRVEWDGSIYGGYYTQDEIREVVAYAKERFVTIIPEIELPGHSLAAITAYPWLACFPEARTYEVRNHWGVENDVLCPGKESTFDFLQGILEEVLPLFPDSEYIHIGGDECPKVRWKACPRCQERIRQEGLKDEDELQSYVIRRIQRLLAQYGKKLVGWDEILEGGLAPSATVMSWRGEEGGIRAANMGHDVIMTPASGGLYVDHYQGDPKIEPVAIGGYAPLAKTYAYDPVPAAIAPEKRHHIRGAQVSLWTAYLYRPELVDYRAYPRLLALAELTWTPRERKDFADFCHRLDQAYGRLDQHQVNYHIPLPEQPLPGVTPETKPEERTASLSFVAFTDSTHLELTTTRPIRIVYTQDGSEPSAHSSTYTAPLPITQSQVVKVASVLPTGKLSRVRAITFEKQALTPAWQPSSLQPGLRTRISAGHYLRASELASATNWIDSLALSTEALRPDHVSNRIGEVQPRSVIGEGYIHIPADGVYVFSTNLDQLWLDGKLLIDNSGETPKYSRHDTSRALQAGWHRIRLIFLGAVHGGFPTYWDEGKVLFRPIQEGKFAPVTPEMLAH